VGLIVNITWSIVSIGCGNWRGSVPPPHPPQVLFMRPVAVRKKLFIVA